MYNCLPCRLPLLSLCLIHFPLLSSLTFPPFPLSPFLSLFLHLLFSPPPSPPLPSLQSLSYPPVLQLSNAVLSELQRSIKDKLPTSQQLRNSICTTDGIKRLKLTPSIWQAMNTLDSPTSECTFCVCPGRPLSLMHPSAPTPPHPSPMGDLLELVQVALTTPSLSTLLSVVLPQCSLCGASYNITDKPCGSLLPRVGANSLPSPWSSFPPSLLHIRDSVVQDTVGAVESTYCGGLVVCCRR